MLQTIAQKSINTSQKQGDAKVAAGGSSEQELFSQFSEILDKIASSLSDAQKKQGDQVVGDMSTALSQAAAAQIQRAPVAEKTSPTKPKNSSEGNDQRQAKEVVSKESSVAAASKAVQDDSKVAAESKNIEGVALPSKVAEPQSGQVKQVFQEKEAVTDDQPASQQEVPQQEEEFSQAELATPLDEEVSARVGGAAREEFVAGEVVVEEAAVHQLPTSSQDQSNEVPVIKPETEGTDIVEASVDESQVVAVADQETTVSSAPREKEASLKSSEALLKVDSPIRGSEAAAQEQIEVQGTAAANEEFVATTVKSEVLGSDQMLSTEKARAASLEKLETLSNEMIIAQSLESLFQQAQFAAPIKQIVESVLSQKTFNSSGQIQAGQGIGNSQIFGSASGEQGRSAQVEKNLPKELPRSLALKTMERVESALKEVARSKDGKTISLRLDPPSLGTLKIDVTLKDGQLHARFIGESAQVNALLRDQSHELQQMLRRAGVHAEKIVISVAGDPSLDLSEGFQTFDQKASQQFRDSSNRPGTFAGQHGGAGDAGAQNLNRNPVDHWVA